MSFNDPTHLPKPYVWEEAPDEDEAYDDFRQQQVDEEEAERDPS